NEAVLPSPLAGEGSGVRGEGARRSGGTPPRPWSLEERHTLMIRRWGEGFQMEGGLVAALRGGLKALTLIWAGSLLGAACAFLTQVLLARSLGPVQYGIFAAALATATLLAPL